MARKSNTRVDYAMLSETMQQNTEQIWEKNRQSEVAEPKEVIYQRVEEPVAPVRKAKKLSKIKRANGVCLYLEDRHKMMMEDVVFNNRLRNQQRLLQTALDEFLKMYYRGDRLTEEGMRLIRAYEDSVRG